MLNSLYDRLAEQSGAAPIIISIAIMLFSGFLMTRITKRLRLPNVTAYIVAGILIGPHCLDLIPESVIVNTEFLADIALAFIAFGTGEFFKFSKLKSSAARVTVITLAEALTASLAVFALCFFILHLELSFSLVLAALASATAPASTMMTIRQTGAKGDFVDTLLQVVAYDDIVALVAYSIAISVASAASAGERFSILSIILPILKNLLVLALGGVFGIVMKMMIHRKRSTDNRLIIAIALLFTFCGICAAMNISPLLGCMLMGTVYINISEDDKLFKQLGYFSPPILLMFFVRSGLSFDLNALFDPAGAIGGVPLIIIGILYFAVRIVGKYAGAFLGCTLVKKDARTRNYLGLALIPQAGVAIGLAAMGARILGGEAGAALNTVILASSVLYELIGPASSKLALYLSGSYSERLEDIVDIDPRSQDGEGKSDVEQLIERIQKIQEEMRQEKISEEELAFTEAAEEHRERLAVGRFDPNINKSMGGMKK